MLPQLAERFQIVALLVEDHRLGAVGLGGHAQSLVCSACGVGSSGMDRLRLCGSSVLFQLLQLCPNVDSIDGESETGARTKTPTPGPDRWAKRRHLWQLPRCALSRRFSRALHTSACRVWTSISSCLLAMFARAMRMGSTAAEKSWLLSGGSGGFAVVRGGRFDRSGGGVQFLMCGLSKVVRSKPSWL